MLQKIKQRINQNFFKAQIKNYKSHEEQQLWYIKLQNQLKCFQSSLSNRLLNRLIFCQSSSTFKQRNKKWISNAQHETHSNQQKVKQGNKFNQNKFQKPFSKKFNKNSASDNNTSGLFNSIKIPQKSFAQNINQSIISQIMRLQTVQRFSQFYQVKKQYFNPRIIAFASRILCTLIEKQKRQNKINYHLKFTLRKTLNDIFQLSPKNMIEQIQTDQLKNLLFFIRKILQQFKQIYQNQNDPLYQKTITFKNELIERFLSNEVSLSSYEVNQIVEIFYNLIRLSEKLEHQKFYKQILRNSDKIKDNINPQYLFSSTNFMLIVKKIQETQNKDKQNKSFESQALQRKYRDNKIFNHLKSSKQINNKDQANSNKIQQLSKDEQNYKKLQQLRFECYKLFYNKWLYYYEDMFEFLKLQQLKHIWHVIILSKSGPKMLFRQKQALRTFKIIQRLLNKNNTSSNQLFYDIRVFSNTFVSLLLLNQKYPHQQTISKLMKESQTKILNSHLNEKFKIKIRAQTFLQLLTNLQCIGQAEVNSIKTYLEANL